jgi:hypothetical protein
MESQTQEESNQTKQTSNNAERKMWEQKWHATGSDE